MRGIFGVGELRSGKKPNWTGLTRLLLMLWLILVTGCVSVKMDRTSELMEAHPKGFRDAVNASDESQLFVKEALRAIIDLEARLEDR